MDSLQTRDFISKIRTWIEGPTPEPAIIHGLPRSRLSIPSNSKYSDP